MTDFGLAKIFSEKVTPISPLHLPKSPLYLPTMAKIFSEQADLTLTLTLTLIY